MKLNLLTALLIGSISIVSAQTYDVVDLESVIPWAINNQGVVAGSGTGGGVLAGQAVRCLEDNCEPIGGVNAYQVNEPGELVGDAESTTFQTAVFWRRGSTEPTYLPVLPGVGGSAALDRNSRGLTVGSGSFVSSGGPGRSVALAWFDQQVFQLPSLGTSAIAHAVNNSGDIVGCIFDSEWKAVIWIDDEVQELPGPRPSCANTINSRGDIGGYAGRVPTGGFRPHLWSRSGHQYRPEALELDRFLGGEVLDLNDQSVAVGYGIDPQPGQGFRDTRALQWSASGELQNLNDALNNPDWLLTRAQGINNGGVVVGRGDFQGLSHGWMLTPK